MTVEARSLIFFSAVSFDRCHDIRVTFTARTFGDLATALGDLNRIRETSHREIIRMPETVSSLGPVFADKIVRGMAVVAGGDVSMTALDPTIQLLLHDMAIGAGLGIVR